MDVWGSAFYPSWRSSSGMLKAFSRVIIVGGAFNDKDNETKNNFVASGFLQAQSLINKGVSPSNITMVIANTGFTEEEMKTFTAMGRGMGISVVAADSKEEVLNYLNYGDVTGQTDLREGDGQKIASTYVYSHGLGYYRSPSNPPVNSVALAYDGGTFPMSWQITAEDILGLKKSAFLPDSVTVFYSCNAGTRGPEDMAITAAWAQATGGYAFGVGDIWQQDKYAGGQTNYENIGGLKDLQAKNFPTKGIALANSAGSAWCLDKPDGSTDIFDIVLDGSSLRFIIDYHFDNLMR